MSLGNPLQMKSRISLTFARKRALGINGLRAREVSECHKRLEYSNYFIACAQALEMFYHATCSLTTVGKVIARDPQAVQYIYFLIANYAQMKHLLRNP